jgi:hypothetical protein
VSAACAKSPRDWICCYDAQVVQLTFGSKTRYSCRIFRVGLLQVPGSLIRAAAAMMQSQRDGTHQLVKLCGGAAAQCFLLLPFRSETPESEIDLIVRSATNADGQPDQRFLGRGARFSVSNYPDAQLRS